MLKLGWEREPSPIKYQNSMKILEVNDQNQMNLIGIQTPPKRRGAIVQS